MIVYLLKMSTPLPKFINIIYNKNMFPTFRQESKLLKKYSCVAGLDEAGRGAWAGPIVAGAILMEQPELKIPRAVRKIIRDSKLLLPHQRQTAWEFLNTNFQWAVGIVSHDEIDCLGIQAANQRAMELAAASLEVRPEFLLVDGRGFEFEIDYKNIIDGDYKVFCIAAASIIAKVARDRLLVVAAKNYPVYHFEQNKGYGTFAHYQALCQYGRCAIHRRSFLPMKNMV